MNLLFLSRWFPWPPDNGSKIRIYNLLRCLAQVYSVDLISFTDRAVEHEYAAKLEKYCSHVSIVPYRPFQPTRTMALLGLFSSVPRSVLDTDSAEFRAEVQRLIQIKRYDVVVASQVDMAPYALSIPRQSAGVRILEEIEVSTLYEQQKIASLPLSRIRRALMWQKWLHYLNRLLPQFDAYTTVSEPEYKRLSVFLNPRLSIRGIVIPNGVDISLYQDVHKPLLPDTLVYSGALTFNANFDAVNFFMREILPIISSQRPGINFRVTGKTEPGLLAQLPASDHVTYTGYLPDIRPTIAESWLNVVPLRIGGGTRLKILESLALGTPVIATNKGAEGLDLIPESEIIIADQPGEFASRTVQLLTDPERRAQLSLNGRMAVVKYDWQKIGDRLLDLIASLKK